MVKKISLFDFKEMANKEFKDKEFIVASYNQHDIPSCFEYCFHLSLVIVKPQNNEIIFKNNTDNYRIKGIRKVTVSDNFPYSITIISENLFDKNNPYTTSVIVR